MYKLSTAGPRAPNKPTESIRFPMLTADTRESYDYLEFPFTSRFASKGPQSPALGKLAWAVYHGHRFLICYGNVATIKTDTHLLFWSMVKLIHAHRYLHLSVKKESVLYIKVLLRNRTDVSEGNSLEWLAGCGPASSTITAFWRKDQESSSC